MASVTGGMFFPVVRGSDSGLINKKSTEFIEKVSTAASKIKNLISKKPTAEPSLYSSPTLSTKSSSSESLRSQLKRGVMNELISGSKQLKFEGNRDEIFDTFTQDFTDIENEKVTSLLSEGSYTKDELTMCIISKRRYNEDLPYEDLFGLLARGSDMLTELGDDSKSFELKTEDDSVALMWAFKAKEGVDMYNRGTTKLALPQGDSGRFLKKFKKAGAQYRLSTHFQNLRMGMGGAQKGLGIDIPNDELRKKTPFGLGSILIHPVYNNSSDQVLLKQTMDHLKDPEKHEKPEQLGVDDISTLKADLIKVKSKDEMSVAIALQNRGEFDFSLGVKLETVGFGDRALYTFTHIAKTKSLVGGKYINKKSNEYKTLLKDKTKRDDVIPSQKQTLNQIKRRENLDSFSVSETSAISFLATKISGFSMGTIVDWKPGEFKLSSSQLEGGTYVDLIKQTESFLKENNVDLDGDNDDLFRNDSNLDDICSAYFELEYLVAGMSDKESDTESLSSIDSQAIQAEGNELVVHWNGLDDSVFNTC